MNSSYIDGTVIIIIISITIIIFSLQTFTCSVIIQWLL